MKKRMLGTSDADSTGMEKQSIVEYQGVVENDF
jgi:hypothetical protein